MQIDVENSPPADVYQALIGSVTPRPIGWVTTVDEEGRVNLAPYSFFNAVSGRPPMVAYAAARKRDGSIKDSHRNAAAVGEFVWNVATEELAEAVNVTSLELPHGTSEVPIAGLSLVPSVRVRPPRVAESPIHFECRVWKIIPMGEEPTTHLVIGTVVYMHLAEAILTEKGRVDPRKLKALGRLGGLFYSRTSDVFELPRPE
ncbi:MAG TPA: flavin reductase family protein [Gemmatales bacterium]|nr:flavin reductase family protein [Gemmatales bacterium]HMP57954.1 flavin reductase family protein [Gemmatales bacterium]